MKIATWNVERLKHRNKLSELTNICNKYDADILVLTETDTQLSPLYPYHIETMPLLETEIIYAPTERRVSIFSKYPCIRKYETYDECTAICGEFKTERGNLLVYGTIIGVLGNRHRTFSDALTKQSEDIRQLSALGKKLCICGDYNCSFSDNYYFTNAGRSQLLNVFDEAGIRLLTSDVTECVDHIAVSSDLIGEANITVNEWNIQKSLSDHKGVAVLL